MHMADALIAPAVGGAMLAVTAGLEAYSIKKIEKQDVKEKLPLMATIGAFVFSAQMVNFTIPGTGASGHLCGGILLAALLGPHAGFLSLSVILAIQALFFADGGLLAYGCNVFNMAFYSCYISYPLIYKAIMKKGFSAKRLWIATIFASVVSLQMGALSVVIETMLSGKVGLTWQVFLLAMQPIHLAIGIVEGAIIACVLSFVHKTNPVLLESTQRIKQGKSQHKWLGIVLVIVIAVAGIISNFASGNPDGLEWSIQKVTGSEALEAEGEVYEAAENLQERTAIMPDYDFKKGQNQKMITGATAAGILGVALTFLLIGVIGCGCYVIKRLSSRTINK